MRHHFDLQDYDLGVRGTQSFVLRYVRNSCESRKLDDHENELLGNWIRGLFLTEGITDELMSTSSPKDFPLLAATFFDQSLRACQAGKLSIETLKGGFECEQILRIIIPLFYLCFAIDPILFWVSSLAREEKC